MTWTALIALGTPGACNVAAQQLWVLAASAKWEYDSFGEPLPEADTLEALAALVPGRGFGG